ncbi:MAG: hypothetical protein ACOCUL_04245, partial [Bacteroidota bacterium]
RLLGFILFLKIKNDELVTKIIEKKVDIFLIRSGRDHIVHLVQYLVVKEKSSTNPIRKVLYCVSCSININIDKFFQLHPPLWISL